MKLNFCTLFNSNYLTRGLVMYDSLVKHCPRFHLYIFTFDDKAKDILKKLDLPNITIITLAEFEDEDLLAIKPSRSAVEYCWTCTPSTILYCINRFGLDHCTYIDADLLFYSDPEILINEMGDKSVLITEHRYTPEYDQSNTSGKYCVQFMCFKNNENGIHVLNWWRNACNEWCYDRIEEGKFGDQKYLDDWIVRFKGVHELNNIGGGVAPWNVQQYEFGLKDGRVMIRDRSGDFVPLVFFHFHGLKFFLERVVLFSYNQYELSIRVKKLIYHPYVALLLKAKKKVNIIDSSFDPHTPGHLGEKIFWLPDILKMYGKAILSLRLRNVNLVRRKIAEQKKLNYSGLSRKYCVY